jgi:DNA (cytosine-5)-methyltransferase 1
MGAAGANSFKTLFMNHIGLFEGVGGFSLAARWMGWKTKAWCEINPFCQQVLKHHFPYAQGHSDIKTTDFTIYRGQCDIITGGFPCQPYSLAGKRKGNEDERHLWPEMLRGIREIQPTWVVGENVHGLINWSGGLVFDEVQTDLEAAGYEVFPYVLPACGVNAPHRRDRIWFIAYSISAGTRCENGTIGDEGRRAGEDRPAGIRQAYGEASTSGLNTTSSNEPTPNSYNTGIQRRQASGYTEIGGALSNKQFGRYYKLNDWQKFPTVSPVCNGNDGLPAGLDTTTLSFSRWRRECIKAGGNAIVPQVAYQIFKAIEQYELFNINEPKNTTIL